MLRILRDLLISIFVLSFGSASASEVDLIYNLSGENSQPSQAAWHGASIAAQTLQEHGHGLNLVLYNGQSRQTVNHAIAVMRSKSGSVPIMIGLGSPSLIEEAAKPQLDAHKIFISASSVSTTAAKNLGANFFTVATSEEARAARLLEFIDQKFTSNTLLIVTNDAKASRNDFKAIQRAKGRHPHRIIPVSLSENRHITAAVQAKLDRFPGAIIILTDPSMNAKWLASLRNQAITAPVVVQTITHMNAYEKKLARHFQSAFFITPKHHTKNIMLLKHFRLRYKNRYGYEPSTAAYNGYNAVMLAASGLQEVNNNESVKLLSTAMRRILSNIEKIESPLLPENAHVMHQIDLGNTQVAIG